jgi:hypothetical protein
MVTSLLLAAIAVVPRAAITAPDSLLGNFSDVLRMLHMYTAADGSTHVDEIALPARKEEGGGLARSFYDGPASRARLLYLQDGFHSDYHYGAPGQDGAPGHVVLFLQGTYVINVSDDKEIRVSPGTLLFAEDKAGRGHRTRCEAKELSKVCLLLQVDLLNANSQILFPGK